MPFHTCLLALIAVLLAQHADAFCVYNDTNKKAQAEQIYLLRGMKKDVPPNDSRCCNWQNDDCNGGGKKTSVVKFTIIAEHWSNAVRWSGEMCGELDSGDNAIVETQAGGTVRVLRNPKYDSKKSKSYANPPYLAHAYDADGKFRKAYSCPFKPRNVGIGDVLGF